MNPTRIKICGITRPEDARAAAQCGADAIGLVFYSRSPRAVTLQQAQACISELPPFVSVVGLFVNEPVEAITRILSELPLDVLQFHGDESPEFCDSFARPYLKAVRVKAETDIGSEITRFDSARGVLLDTWKQGIPGGTGEAFDWRLVEEGVGDAIVLAGGLSPDNVAEAIVQVRPAAVDVSGGVETSPGIKSFSKIRAFISAVRAADQRVDGM